MALADYVQAQRAALKSYSADTAAHRSPYLVCLEDTVEGLNALPKVDLGLCNISLERIRGTCTSARSTAFASNFMPLLAPESEFARKWSILYDSIVEQGVRQPISCLEYMGNYYVLEGNKRVSVMRFLGVLVTEAMVTRVLIPLTDEPENRLYHEYLSFYDDTGLDLIYFSEEGSFDKLINLSGHTKGEKWSDEDTIDLRALFVRFADAYKRIYGSRMRMPAADAFLLYLEINGYDPACMPSEIAEKLKAMERELLHADSGDNVSLIMEPKEQKSGLLNTLFGPASVKAAFVYHHSPRDSGWNYWHDLGRINAENELGSKLETTVCICKSPEAFEPEMRRLIEEGNRLIFATSPLMLDAAAKLSVSYPETIILNCSLLAEYYHVRSYYLRIYETKFIIGMIAGALTENGRIGYIADYPIYGVPASINAFALGARMVNPNAKICLRWSSSLDFDPADPFPGEDIHIISNRDISAPSQSSIEYGLYSVHDSIVKNLAIPVLDWSKFYVPTIRSVLNGTFENTGKSLNAMNYWWGMSSDTLDVILSTKFDPYLRRLVDHIRTHIEGGIFKPFEGQLIAQDGSEKCSSQSQLTPADILTMDYLIDNVIGSFPKKEELRPGARDLVRMLGVLEIPKPDKKSFSWKN